MAHKPKPEDRVTVKMLRSERGVDDGEIYAKLFVKDESYSIGPDLTASFLKEDACVVIKKGATVHMGEGSAEETKADDQDLSKFTKAELIEYAAECGVEVDAKNTKPVIVAAIMAAIAAQGGETDGDGEDGSEETEAGESEDETE